MEAPANLIQWTDRKPQHYSQHRGGHCDEHQSESDFLLCCHVRRNHELQGCYFCFSINYFTLIHEDTNACRACPEETSARIPNYWGARDSPRLLILYSK